ncbi:MAG: hypothetical protein WDZ76_12250 [Pseudohongiellaceae bacterium]
MKIFNWKWAALIVTVLMIVVMVLIPMTAEEPLFPVTEISVARQTEMMENYCVMCHLDRAKNGGLSLEHFDAATVSPALATMLVSKFTTGVPLEEILKPEKDAVSVEAIEAGKKMGAPSVMGVAGLPLPTDSEINGFIMAMADRTRGAEQWHVARNGDVVSADISRVTPLPVREGRRDLTYRLALTCDASSGEGEIMLSWSPMPAHGTLEAVVDGDSPIEFVLDQWESMANGDPGRSPPSSVMLAGSGMSDTHTSLVMPQSTLEISGPLPTDTVAFSFRELAQSDQRLLSVCFAG